TTSELADGPHAITAVATDGAGNPYASSAALDITIDTAAPAVGVTTVTDPITAANAADTEASGTADDDATVTVVATDAGNAHSTTPATPTVASGSWTASGIDTSGLDDGTITYSA